MSEDKNESKIYKTYCLVLTSLLYITRYFTASAMPQFYGYGVIKDEPHDFYQIREAGIGMNSETYG